MGFTLLLNKSNKKRFFLTWNCHVYLHCHKRPRSDFNLPQFQSICVTDLGNWAGNESVLRFISMIQRPCLSGILEGREAMWKKSFKPNFSEITNILPSPLCWKTPFRHLLHSTILLSFSKLASSPQLWFMWNISHRFVFLSTEFPDKSAWERRIVGSFWWCWTCQGFLEDQHGCKPLSQILPWLLTMMGYVLSSYELEQILLRSLSTGVREVIVPEAVKMNSTFRYRGTHLLSVHSQVNGFQCRIPCLFCSVLCV